MLSKTHIDERLMLKQAKAQFLAKLAKFGIADNIVVALMRKPRDGVIAYYGNMSQFRNKPRIVVNVVGIQDHYCSWELIEEEILKSIAHEWAHSVAEAIRELPRISGYDKFDVPAWQPVFNNDEEFFAEDFARFCVTFDSHREEFWAKFLPLYAAEFTRIFWYA